MNKKPIIAGLVAVALVLFICSGILGGENSLAVLCLPFTWVAAGLRKLSLSGSLGNAVAIALLVVAGLPPLVLKWKKSWGLEDALLIFTSIAIWYTLYVLINPYVHRGVAALRQLLQPVSLLGGAAAPSLHPLHDRGEFHPGYGNFPVSVCSQPAVFDCVPGFRFGQLLEPSGIRQHHAGAGSFAVLSVFGRGISGVCSGVRPEWLAAAVRGQTHAMPCPGPLWGGGLQEGGEPVRLVPPYPGGGASEPDGPQCGGGDFRLPDLLSGGCRLPASCLQHGVGFCSSGAGIFAAERAAAPGR